MISVDFATHRFQLRAAAVVTDGDFVLLHRPEGDTVWALPGGRVDPGEATQDAVVREFSDQVVLLVAHGFVAKVIRALLLDLSTAYFFTYAMRNGEVERYSLTSDASLRWSIQPSVSKS